MNNKKIILKKRCRLCQSSDLKLCFSFPKTPLANEFVTKRMKQETYPLDLAFCKACYHLQLKHVVSPKILFSNYLYVSGTSKSFINHFENYAESIITKYKIKKNELILEIGSNDGVFLNAFKKRGYKNIIGIEPAKEIAKNSNNKGIKTINSFFDKNTIKKINKTHGKSKLILANNVFAHIDNLGSVFDNINVILKEDGFVYFEVSYLLDVLKKNLFDTIYHEHLSYHAVIPMINFLRSKNLYLIDFQRVKTHGGSIRFIVSKNQNFINKSKINKIKKLEIKNNLLKHKTYMIFYKKIIEQKEKFTKKINFYKKLNKKIVGYGAPAKMTTLIYTFNIKKEYFDFIIDDSSIKQNLYSPGLNIKILSSKNLTINKAEVCVVFAWNFFEQIKKKHYKWINQGGIFINPLK